MHDGDSGCIPKGGMCARLRKLYIYMYCILDNRQRAHSKPFNASLLSPNPDDLQPHNKFDSMLYICHLGARESSEAFSD